MSQYWTVSPRLFQYCNSSDTLSDTSYLATSRFQTIPPRLRHVNRQLHLGAKSRYQTIVTRLRRVIRQLQIVCNIEYCSTALHVIKQWQLGSVNLLDKCNSPTLRYQTIESRLRYVSDDWILATLHYVFRRLDLGFVTLWDMCIAVAVIRQLQLRDIRWTNRTLQSRCQLHIKWVALSDICIKTKQRFQTLVCRPRHVIRQLHLSYFKLSDNGISLTSHYETRA